MTEDAEDTTVLWIFGLRLGDISSLRKQPLKCSDPFPLKFFQSSIQIPDGTEPCFDQITVPEIVFWHSTVLDTWIFILILELQGYIFQHVEVAFLIGMEIYIHR